MAYLQSITTITVGPRATPAERSAARILQAHLRNATGLLRNISTPAAAAAAAAQQFAVGFDAAAALGLADELDARELGNESFLLTANRSAKLRSGPCSIAMSGAQGSARGTLYAVFAFLRAIGFEWYAPDEIVVPWGGTVSAATPAPMVDVKFIMALETRDTDAWPVPQASDWAMAMGYNGPHHSDDPRFGGNNPTYATPPGPVHTSYTLFDPSTDRAGLPPPELWQKHPEWMWPRNRS